MYLDLLGEPATIICSTKEVTGSNQLAFSQLCVFPSLSVDVLLLHHAVINEN